MTELKARGTSAKTSGPSLGTIVRPPRGVCPTGSSWRSPPRRLSSSAASPRPAPSMSTPSCRWRRIWRSWRWRRSGSISSSSNAASTFPSPGRCRLPACWSRSCPIRTLRSSRPQAASSSPCWSAALAGVANGLVVALLRVPPLVATIGVNAILIAAALVVSQGSPHTSPPWLSAMAQGRPLACRTLRFSSCVRRPRRPGDSAHGGRPALRRARRQPGRRGGLGRPGRSLSHPYFRLRRPLFRRRRRH